MRTAGRAATAIALALVAAGCGTTTPSSTEVAGITFDSGAPPTPAIDVALAERGEPLYQAHCAACHGADLSGAPEWKQPDDDGSYKPPPMDSSGHTWHHSDFLLLEIISTGSPDPDSAMVGFSDRLSTGEIEAVIEFLKSTWGAEERSFQWAVTWQEAERENR